MEYPPAHLETERLNIRPLTLGDVETWRPFTENKEAMRFMEVYYPPEIKDRAISWIMIQLKRYEEGRMGLMALIDKKTKKLVGQCGLLAKEIDNIPEIEVAYHILPQYWGLGYAPEAARFFMNFAFENNISKSVTSTIVVGNVKSQRVAEKNNFLLEKQTTQLNQPVLVYRKVK